MCVCLSVYVCLSVVEEVEKLLLENTEVGHGVLHSLMLDVCVSVCLSMSVCLSWRRWRNYYWRTLRLDMMHFTLSCWMYVCLSVCLSVVEEVEKLLLENTEVRHDALHSLMLDVCVSACLSMSVCLSWRRWRNYYWRTLRLDMVYFTLSCWMYVCLSVCLCLSVCHGGGGETTTGEH